MFMHPSMTTDVELTLCSKEGCGEGWSRICGGESCVKVFLRNSSGEEGYVGITPNFPAKIIPLKFGSNTAVSVSHMEKAIVTNLNCDSSLIITV
jgi:uncharacterized protein (AIM24 family)